MVEKAGLPVKNSNRRLVEQRLQCQINRFREQPTLLEKYDLAITTYFDD